MIRQQHGPLVAYEFESLRGRSGVAHGIFTRHGGVSPTPWHSLNLSTATGDSAANAEENTRRVCGTFGLSAAEAVTSRQVHGSRVAAVTAGQRGQRVGDYDGLISDVPGTVLMQRHADCPPILLFDPRRRAIGIAHAGWRGTLANICAETVRAMGDTYGSQPSDLIAAVGPAIGVCCYHVGEDVQQAFAERHEDARQWLVRRPNGKVHLDLWQANRTMLFNAGVRQIEVAGICTACHVDDFYSARRENRRNGCFASAIMLPESKRS